MKPWKGGGGITTACTNTSLYWKFNHMAKEAKITSCLISSINITRNQFIEKLKLMQEKLTAENLRNISSSLQCVSQTKWENSKAVLTNGAG